MQDGQMYDTLTEKFIRVRERGGQNARTTMPGLLALLMQDNVETLPAMRPHQRHGLHSMLVQTAVMGMEQAGVRTPPRDESSWREILEGLTPGYPGHEPWCLVVENPRAPAFMQPPCDPEGYPEKFRQPATSPGNLDVLVHSKNHEVKQHAVRHPEPDDWMMAILNMQTMDGSSGSGRKGISRIQTGSYSRPALSLMPLDGMIGAEVRRDVLALRQALPGIREQYGFYPAQGGITLVWTVPWDGLEEERLMLDELHPLYVEISRRMRMSLKDGAMMANYTTSEKPRIRGKEDWKATGDPWAPVYARTGQVMRVTSEDAFSYRDLTACLLGGDWLHPPLLRPTPMEQEEGAPMVLVARATARVQGKTFGHHERRIIMNHRFQQALVDPEVRQEAGEIALDRIQQAGDIQKMLRSAARTFMEGGDRQRMTGKTQGRENPEHKRNLNAAGKRFTQLVDARFFQEFQRELEAPTAERPAIRQDWIANRRAGIAQQARNVLQETIESGRHQGRDAWRAQADAENQLEGRLRGPKGPLHRSREQDAQDGTENAGAGE